MRQVVLYPGQDGYWVVEVPSLPGCVSQGKTKDEAIANAHVAINLWIEVMREKGQPVPPDTMDVQICVIPTAA